MCRTVHRVALVVIALALVPSQGFGWGRDGHQVIANLAQSRLSPPARKGIAALLHGATLASVPTYTRTSLQRPLVVQCSMTHFNNRP